MKTITRRRKKNKESMEALMGNPELLHAVAKIATEGKNALDLLMHEMGRTFVESLFYMERETLSGPDYHPIKKGLNKWASQQGSVYLGDYKLNVQRPRIRDSSGEVHLQSYEKLKQGGIFSEELFGKVMNGLSARRYKETLLDTVETIGMSPTSISNKIIEVTTKKLKEFRERSLEKIDIFAMFLDGIHFGDSMFIVGLGLDVQGNKHLLGFWEGATENNEVCKELLLDMEQRGLSLHHGVIFSTDGGSGIIKALREKFGEDLVHQRCILHKERNILMHLPKKYRNSAKSQFNKAMELKKYKDAKKGLIDFEKWLREINESAANSLNECIEELLTCHYLEVPELLAKTLITTNPIESVFSKVREAHHKVKRNRGTKMAQRWLGSILLYAENGFRKVKGFESIPEIARKISKGMRAIPEPKAA